MAVLESEYSDYSEEEISPTRQLINVVRFFLVMSITISLVYAAISRGVTTRDVRADQNAPLVLILAEENARLREALKDIRDSGPGQYSWNFDFESYGLEVQLKAHEALEGEAE